MKNPLGRYHENMRGNLRFLVDIIERHGVALRSVQRRVGAHYGLQPVHLQTLVYLERANRYSNTPQALAEYLGLTKGTVSQSLLLLHNKKLIKRVQDETDKRVVRLALSTKGERLVQAARLHEEWEQIAKFISPTRLRITYLVLQETWDTMRTQSGGGSFGVCQGCTYHEREGQRTHRCGLTGERLNIAETKLICREHLPRGQR
ncbi:MAG: MarR family winged helix-turn-helix transcriptional regulator [Burkholderiales bacterium]